MELRATKPAELALGDRATKPAELAPGYTLMLRPGRAVVRRDLGMWALESALYRRGFEAVAGVDEAGRGACAGPMVIAACVLPPGPRGRIDGLADSKLLTAAARDRAYEQVIRRARAWSVVIVPPGEIDCRGLHVCNVEGMRRAFATLPLPADYVLTDGFPVPGFGVPSLAVWKGDQVSACVAAASVLAKVTRDRMMTELHERFPLYDFATHKGYSTRGHAAALKRHGPCPEHRTSYVNVARVRHNGQQDSSLSDVEDALQEAEQLLAAEGSEDEVVMGRTR